MAAVPAIEAKHLRKLFDDGAGGVVALDDVTLTVPSGEFLSVRGPSGSGKTTLLHLLSGIDLPSSGRVEIAGNDLSALSDDERSDLRRREVGFVFQNFNLLPGLTVEENVAWPLELGGLRWRDALRRAVRCLEAVGIAASTSQRRPGEISCAERQRVAIARALAPEPSILFADEPTGNLDSRAGEEILDFLTGLNEERKITIVMVTHSAFPAACGHRTIELANGRVVHKARAPAREAARVIRLRD